MQTSPGISARGVRRRFGQVEAVADIDLEAPSGEVTALVGPNGSGKTTLFLVLATLLVPDAGEVSVGGFDPVTEPDAVRALLGWSPDVFGRLRQPHRPGVPRVLRGRLPPAEARSAARAPTSCSRRSISRSTPTRRCTSCPAGRSSGSGWPARWYIDPTVLVLDEPASGLDPRSRVDLRELLRAQAAAGTTVLVSSHVLSDLQEVADRAVFIQGGRTVGQHNLADLPSAQRRPWRIKAVDNVGLVDALDAMRMPHSEPGPTGVEVELGSEEEAADVIVALVRAGVRVVAIAPSGGDLEAAYLELTQDRR